MEVVRKGNRPYVTLESLVTKKSEVRYIKETSLSVYQRDPMSGKGFLLLIIVSAVVFVKSLIHGFTGQGLSTGVLSSSSIRYEKRRGCRGSD